MGTLVLAEPPRGTTYAIDGQRVSAGAHQLLPGSHWVTAQQEGVLRTWRAEVPVLADRTVQVGATFSQAESRRWVQAQLALTFDTLQAPPEVTRLLSDWALRHELDQLVLLHVDVADVAARPRTVDISGPDPLRPPAAEGERVDHGDGIPATYAEQVLAAEEAARNLPPPRAERRLRILYYDPALQRFSLEPALAARPEVADPRFRMTVFVGYTGMLDHAHIAADLGAAWRIGPVSVEGRLGLVRADSPYALYPDWQDLQL